MSASAECGVVEEYELPKHSWSAKFPRMPSGRVVAGRGAYNGLYLRINEVLTTEEIDQVLPWLEEVVGRAACFVGLADAAASPVLLAALKAVGFTDYALIADVAELASSGRDDDGVARAVRKGRGEAESEVRVPVEASAESLRVLVKWYGDGPSPVQAYASSIRGGHMVVLDAELRNTFLIKWWGGYTFPGGAVDLGENSWEAAVREVREEIGVELDVELLQPRLVYSYSKGEAHQGRIGDEMHVFLAAATAGAVPDFDTPEVKGDGKIVPVDAILDAFDALGATDPAAIRGFPVTVAGETFTVDPSVGLALAAWRSGAGLPVWTSRTVAAWSSFASAQSFKVAFSSTLPRFSASTQTSKATRTALSRPISASTHSAAALGAAAGAGAADAAAAAAAAAADGQQPLDRVELEKPHLVYPERWAGPESTVATEAAVDAATPVGSSAAERAVADALLSSKAAGAPLREVDRVACGRGTYLSTLSNGLRVITQQAASAVGAPAASVGLYVNHGRRAETDASRGATHMLERLAFGATEGVDHSAIVRMVEDDAVTVSATHMRDFLALHMDVLPHHVPKYLDLLAASILEPATDDAYMASVKAYMALDIETASVEYDSLAPTRAEEVAFAGSPLGAPSLFDAPTLDALSPATVMAFRDALLVGPNMVLSGVGIGHDELVGLASTSFASVAAASPPGSDAVFAPLPAEYVGGQRVDVADIDAQPWQHSNVVVGFKAPEWSAPELTAHAVLQMLLGGGFAFSAGGPGKGMYTRLYQTLLARYPWLNSAQAINATFADAGMFSIHASAGHESVGDVVLALVHEIMAIGQEPPSEVAVSRARNMLKSMVAMNLERRAVLVEDMGRQVLLSGEYKTPDVLYQRIDAVTRDQLHAVFRNMVASPPTVYVCTTPSSASVIPPYDELVKAFDIIRSRWQ
ncbi:peptidase subunit alpha [Thecamonas trahens ATCC 50062]|uniref:Alpha-MPP n=1 Tax=Thecamonas trahens ATCC 50062 TaxID=461836 RepID=A0A0L0DU94_THETB|nr:peptidase subunit alpha [Thecamonas trahens ATCC 50062]KNC55840.1 peptidase subunit alpha [Thecamonas trahens ATCC 50062]|eukprot:XP_013752817.1 peptidase subunit alpha [Thecamonas trahens ATCC 50062]